MTRRVVYNNGMGDTYDRGPAGRSAAPSPAPGGSGHIGDTPPATVAYVFVEVDGGPPERSLLVATGEGTALHLARPPWGWQTIPRPEREPQGVPTVLESLLWAAEQGAWAALTAWGAAWHDPDALGPARFVAEPDPWPWPGDGEGLATALRDQVPEVWADGLSLALRGTTSLQKRLGGRAGRVALTPPAVLGEIITWAWACLSDQPPAAVHDDLRKRGIDDIAAFSAASPAARMARLGGIPPLVLVLSTRARWQPGLYARGPASVMGKANRSEDPNALAERISVGVVLRTDSLALVAGLELLWAVRTGLGLRRCPIAGCSRPFLAPDDRHGFCLQHSAPPWASELDARAFARARERGQRSGTCLPWGQWRTKKATVGG